MCTTLNPTPQPPTRTSEGRTRQTYTWAIIATCAISMVIAGECFGQCPGNPVNNPPATFTRGSSGMISVTPNGPLCELVFGLNMCLGATTSMGYSSMAMTNAMINMFGTVPPTSCFFSATITAAGSFQVSQLIAMLLPP